MDKQPNPVNSGVFAWHEPDTTVGVWLTERMAPQQMETNRPPDGMGKTIMQAIRDAYHGFGHPVPGDVTDMDRLQTQVGEWGDRTFPLPPHDAIDHAVVVADWGERLIDHLKEEVAELETNVRYPPVDPPARRDWIAEECADVAIMLMHLAHREGFSLMEAIENKYDANQRRTWETEPGEGRTYRKHVEPDRVALPCNCAVGACEASHVGMPTCPGSEGS